MKVYQQLFNILPLLFVATILVIWFRLTDPEGPGPFRLTEVIDYQNYLQQEDSFSRASFLQVFSLYEPYDIDLDNNNSLYIGLKNGKIVKIQKMYLTTAYNSIGKIYGLKFIDDDKKILMFVDSKRGICQVNLETKESIVLIDNYLSKRFTYLTSLDVSKEGIIYFTETSTKYTHDNYQFEYLEGNPYSRIFMYDQKLKKTTLLLQNLHHATGILLAKDQSYLLIAEQYRFRVLKYYLKGPKKGTMENLIEHLPAFPKNLKYNEKGDVWISLPLFPTSFMLKITNFLHQYPKIRSIMKYLSKDWLNYILFRKLESGAIKINPDNGKIVKVIRGRTRNTEISSLIQKNNTLFFIDHNKKTYATLRYKYLKPDQIQND